ncbi:MAG: hypothetical protein IPJ65_05785 [Archangiaceae bacterium]|nr:hypothetical protein [Archangiaceae bacterium]
MAVTELTLRVALLTVFAAAAASKVGSAQRWRDFARATFELSGLGRPGAVAVVAAELTTVGLLVLAPPLGQALAVVLLTAFAAALARALKAGRQVACRCFGARASPVSTASLTRNGLLVAFAVAGFCLTRLAPGASVTELLPVAIGLGVLVGFALTRWEDLAFAFTGSPRRPFKERRT